MLKTLWLRLLMAGTIPGCLMFAETTVTKAHVQVVVLEPGGKAGLKRVEFSKQAKPGQGKELKVLVSADGNYAVSLVAFSKEGQLVYGVPEIVQLPDGKTKELPLTSKWTWEGHEGLEEIDVIVADPGAGDYKAYEELVKKMGQGGISDDVRRLQAGKMRQWIDEHLRSTTTASGYSIKNQPTEVGGMTRGGVTGQEISVPAKSSTVIRLRISQ
jgi:hypothetical protein